MLLGKVHTLSLVRCFRGHTFFELLTPEVDQSSEFSDLPWCI